MPAATEHAFSDRSVQASDCASFSALWRGAEALALSRSSLIFPQSVWSFGLAATSACQELLQIASKTASELSQPSRMLARWAVTLNHAE